MPFGHFACGEGRFTTLAVRHPEATARLLAEEEHDARRRHRAYSGLAAPPPAEAGDDEAD